MGLLILLLTALGLVVAGATARVLWRVYHPARRRLAWALARKAACDPGEMGLKFEEVEFRFKDGVKTAGWVIEGKLTGAPGSRGPVVVVSHGWGESKYVALGRVGPLVEMASRVVLYDLRGHGDSTDRCCRLGTAEAGDLLEIVEKFATGASGSRPVVLMGYSLGAGVSVVAGGMDEGALVKGVIAEGLYRRAIEPVRELIEQMGLPREPFAWLVEMHMGFWTQGRGEFDRAKHAAKLRCPLLMLHGTEDRVSPPEGAKEVCEAAGRHEWVEFEGGGHGDLAEREPGKYFDAVRRMLKEVERGG